MSWFKRKPTVKNPPERVQHRHSPATERLLKETKEATKPTRIVPKPKK
jgi:hypothetical protein